MRARALWLLLPGLLLAAPAPARVGETRREIAKRFGKASAKPDKQTTVWVIEQATGPLVYTVTFDARGNSIGEGLKPLKRAVLTEAMARTFMEEQLSAEPASATARTVAPGESYTFAGGSLVCGAEETVVVDEARGLLVVRTAGAQPSVIAVTPAMLARQ